MLFLLFFISSSWSKIPSLSPNFCLKNFCQPFFKGRSASDKYLVLLCLRIFLFPLNFQKIVSQDIEWIVASSFLSALENIVHFFYSLVSVEESVATQIGVPLLVMCHISLAYLVWTRIAKVSFLKKLRHNWHIALY